MPLSLDRLLLNELPDHYYIEPQFSPVFLMMKQARLIINTSLSRVALSTLSLKNEWILLKIC
jgi:hypothetical protein